jgi:hypothetical protein
MKWWLLLLALALVIVVAPRNVHACDPFCSIFGSCTDDIFHCSDCSSCSCSNQCNNGDTQCNGNNAQTCVYGSSGCTEWQDTQACTNGCSNGACKGSCNVPSSCDSSDAGQCEYDCPDGTAYYCISNQYMTGRPPCSAFNNACWQTTACGDQVTCAYSGGSWNWNDSNSLFLGGG